MITPRNLEKLDAIYSSLIRLGDFMTSDNPRAFIRTSNALLDTCIDCGMKRDEPCHVAWAGEQITRALLNA